MANSCDIIIPVWNQPGVTRECVDSIIRHTGYPFRLVLIDNGSDSESADYLKGLKRRGRPECLLIRNEDNLGFVKAVNQGLAASDAPYLCVMNNDTIAAPGWLEEMVAVMEAHPGIGLLNPSSNTSGQIPNEGQSVDDYAAGLAGLKGRTQELSTCRGFCMLMKREARDRIGLLDERYGIGYFEETDYCRRARDAGFAMARAKGAYVYHREGSSFKSVSGRDGIFDRNARLFFERWGRPVRAAYLLDRIGSKDAIDDIAVNAARHGHQILVFMKRGLEWPVSVDHFDIRRFDVNPVLFNIVTAYQVIRRRRKKPVDVLLTDNALFGAFLSALKAFHGADVVIKPRKDEFLALLEKKSRES